MNNIIHNASNPHQGEAKRVLCVCSAGLLRSPTAANVLHREYGYNTRSAGLVPDFALIVIDDVLVAWADEIVCMSRAQEEALGLLEGGKPIKCLDIPDNYSYMSPVLQALVVSKYKGLK